MQHLDGAGLAVPVPIPTVDGRLFAQGLTVMTFMEGTPPETEDDWRRVADTLRRLHGLTRGWPQRPGWRSSADLLHTETGTKIDLDRHAPRGRAPLPSGLGAACWTRHLRGSRRPQPAQHPDDGRARRADRLGRVARRRARRALLSCSCSRRGPDDAPTRIRAGSHAAIARQLLPARRACRCGSCPPTATPPPAAARRCWPRARPARSTCAIRSWSMPPNPTWDAPRFMAQPPSGRRASSTRPCRRRRSRSLSAGLRTDVLRPGARSDDQSGRERPKSSEVGKAPLQRAPRSARRSRIPPRPGRTTDGASVRRRAPQRTPKSRRAPTSRIAGIAVSRSWSASRLTQGRLCGHWGREDGRVGRPPPPERRRRGRAPRAVRPPWADPNAAGCAHTMRALSPPRLHPGPRSCRGDPVSGYPRSVVPDGPAAIWSSLGETSGCPPHGKGRGGSFRGDRQSLSPAGGRAGRTPDRGDQPPGPGPRAARPMSTPRTPHPRDALPKRPAGRRRSRPTEPLHRAARTPHGCRNPVLQHAMRVSSGPLPAPSSTWPC